MDKIKPLVLKQHNKKSSTKSNFLIYDTNFTLIVEWLKQFKAYVESFIDSLDVEKIKNDVLTSIQTTKTLILIKNSLVIGFPEEQTVNGQIYIVNRVDSNNIEITQKGNNQWDTERIIPAVKNVDNIIVHPKIQTLTGIIYITFSDNIESNYKLILY